MRLKFMSFLGLLFVVASAIASTANWVLVSGTGAANEYIDLSTIERKGSMAFAWVLGDLAQSRPFKGQQFKSLKYRMEFDCAAGRFRQIHVTLYSGQMGAGAVLESGYVSNPWEPAVPQSVGQTKLQTVCRK